MINNEKGGCEVTTYELDELAGTKLRALYQRKKEKIHSILMYFSVKI